MTGGASWFPKGVDNKQSEGQGLNVAYVPRKTKRANKISLRVVVMRYAAALRGKGSLWVGGIYATELGGHGCEDG